MFANIWELKNSFIKPLFKNTQMKKELKQAIINHIFENSTDFQLINNTTDKFRAYIYDSKGDYLIGGNEVYEFIRDAIELITTQY